MGRKGTTSINVEPEVKEALKAECRKGESYNALLRRFFVDKHVEVYADLLLIDDEDANLHTALLQMGRYFFKWYRKQGADKADFELVKPPKIIVKEAA